MKEAIRALNLALRGGDAPVTLAEQQAYTARLAEAAEQVLAAWIDHSEHHCISPETYRDSQLRALECVEAANKRAQQAEERAAALVVELERLRSTSLNLGDRP